MSYFFPTQATDTFPPNFLKNKMDKDLFIKHSLYMSMLMASGIRGTDPPAPFEGIDWIFLIKLSEKQDVILMIAPAVKKLSLPDDAKALFKELHNFYLARITRQSIEADVVLNSLSSNNIRYIKMKGFHIKDFYPADYMRSRTDIDLCLDKENLPKAKPIMESFGYTLKNTTDYHDEYEKDDFYIFELHSSLVSPKEKYAKIFSEPFSESETHQSDTDYRLKAEYLYLHLFFHLYHHFTTTGCGIRLFADFLVFKEYVKDADFGFIESIIKKYKMTEFYATLKKLLGYFFYGEKCEEHITNIASYIFINETTGVYKYHVASLGFFGKVKYFLKNWFPSAKDLSFRYPVLIKAPVLLPVCWIRRIFYSLFFNRSAFKQQAESIRTASSQEYKKIKNVRRMAEKNK